MSTAETTTETCNGSFDCPATEHDEDTDCYSVTCVPPKCDQHGTEIITCRECAAEPPEGWQLVDCDQGHPVMWMPDDQWCYPAPCMYCCYDAEARAHDGCQHAQHGRWRRWRISHRLVGRAYVLGLVTGSGTRWGGGCNRCLTMIRWRGRRPYILGLPRENWLCLLRYRHRRVDLGGLCAVCCPCPGCGSQKAGHADDCSEVVQ